MSITDNKRDSKNTGNFPGGFKSGPKMAGGRGGHMLPVEKPRDFKGSGRKLISYLKPYRIKILIVLVFSICSTAFTIAGPKILGQITNLIMDGMLAGFQKQTSAMPYDEIGRIILMLLVLYIASFLFNYVQGYVMSGVAMQISKKLRQNIAAKIGRLPISFFDRSSHGDILSRVTNDVDTISHSLGQGLTQIVTSFTTLIGVLIMMLTISFSMTLAALVIVPISAVLITLIVKFSQKFFKHQQKYLGIVNGQVEEIYGGHLVMKAFNGEEQALEEFEKFNSNLYTSSWKSQFLSGMMMPAMSFIGNLGYVAVCLVGGLQAARGKILVGSIVAFIQYVRSFQQPISQAASIANVLQSTVAAAERVFEFLEEDEESSEKQASDNNFASAESLQDIKGDFLFENVAFGYNKGVPVIKNFSFHVKAGQKVAIVGPTGAGKTTLVKLLMRFYETDEGNIYLDGINMRSIRKEDLRQLFGMVLQDTWLFQGTVRENLLYGHEIASEQDMIEAARLSYVDHFIHTLPHGYDMEINEEASNLSQGQKQLLTIARAILAKPRILIFDEATSSVDTRTELLIQQATARLMESRTSFIIAHRLSTIKDADLIIVMRDGDIAEAGKHSDLLEADGFYADLYKSQFEAS